MVKSFKKKCLSIILSLAMVISLMPAVTLTASAVATMVTFVDSEDPNGDFTPITRNIGGAVFTFAPGSSMYDAEYFDILTFNLTGIYAVSTRNGGSGTDFTVSVEPGYTFDLTGFRYEAVDGEVDVYYNGNLTPVSFSGGSLTVIQQSGLTAFNDVTTITFTSENEAVFQDLVIDDVKPTNNTPTDITLSAASVAEDAASGAAIGTFATTDADAGDTFTYALVTGTGDTDNGLFAIQGNQLKLGGTPLDYETKSELSIRVKTTDAADASYEKVFAITVSDVYEAPVLTANTALSLYEDTAQTTIGSSHLKTTVNAGKTLTYTVNNAPAKGTLKIDGTEAASFTQADIDANKLTYTPNPNANGADSFAFSASDGTNVVSGTFSISISSLNDAPTLTGGAVFGFESTDENTASSAVTVASILSAAGYADADAEDSSGIAVTEADGKGTWQYSLDNTNWTNFSTVSGGASLLLSSDTSLRYVPDGKDGETASVTFRGWDKTFGSASSYNVRSTADVTTNGGSTAYSAGTAQANIVVTAVNDLPNVTGLPTDMTVTEKTQSVLNFQGAAIADVDLASGTLTLTLGVDAGALAATSGDGVTVGGTGTALTLTGTLASINTFINASNILYTNTSDTFGDNKATMTLTADDGYGAVSLGTVHIDIAAIAPKITGVASTTADGTYGSGDSIQIQVLFDHAVTVTGTPVLKLETGATDRDAVYTSGSGDSTLTFTYTVQAGDAADDLDYISANALVLNGGTIKRGDENAVLTLPEPGSSGSLSDNKALVIDAIAPPVPMLDLATASDTGSSHTDNLTNDTTPTFTGATEANSTVTLYSDSTLLGSVTADAGGNWSWTVTNALAEGLYSITAYATDAAGNKSAAAELDLTIDTTAPTATVSISKTFFNPGDTAAVTITFSEQVVGFDNGDLTIDNGTLTAVTSLDGGKTFTATFTAASVNAVDNTIDLSLTGVSDAAGNAGTGTIFSEEYAIEIPTVPGAPTDVTAEAGNGQATVTFTAPASDGGKVITGYTVTSSPGGFTANGSKSPITVTGLTNGTAYTFTVMATNAVGTGTHSSASNSVTPKASQTITFGNPGSQIFNTTPTLIATATSGLDVTFTSETPEVCSITSDGALTFLSAGTATITANQEGSSDFLAAEPVTQTFTVIGVWPGAPTGVTATAGNGQAAVSFTAPSSSGGLPITSYTVTASPGDITATGTASPITVTGLTNGTAYTFTVKATNDIGTGSASSASNSVTPRASSGGSSNTGNKAVVEVNGEKQDAGQISTRITGGETVTTITLDDDKLSRILEQEGSGATVSLSVNTQSDAVVGELNGQTIKNMEGQKATLEIKTDTATYTLPADQMNMDAIVQQFGAQVKPGDIKVSIRIAEPSPDTVKFAEDAAKKGGYQIVVQPVAFNISCTYGDKTIQVSQFNSFVERAIAIPQGVDPGKITTGVVLGEDGSVRHVPTQIVTIGGHYYAKIHSLTNSVYSAVYNPLAFKDVEDHWSKDAVNDMGSRLIVTGVGDGSYEPERSITRAEFAAIIVRALGLSPGNTESSFADVSLSDWFNGYVDTASRYGLITGYDSASFGPNDTITREQAMTMIARATKLTGLAASLTDSEISALLSAYTDGADVSAYAKSSAAACLKTGIITGNTATTISPKASVTRAEVAVMVQRLLKQSGLI